MKGARRKETEKTTPQSIELTSFLRQTRMGFAPRCLSLGNIGRHRRITRTFTSSLERLAGSAISFHNPLRCRTAPVVAEGMMLSGYPDIRSGAGAGRESKDTRLSISLVESPPLGRSLLFFSSFPSPSLSLLPVLDRSSEVDRVLEGQKRVVDSPAITAGKGRVGMDV